MKDFSYFKTGFLEGMHAFSINIATIVNTALLLIVYILGVGLTAVVSRLFGKRFLETSLDKNAKTYWQELDLKKEPVESYFRQF